MQSTARRLAGFFFFGFTFGGIDTDFFIILFEGSEIFSGFGEFTFFHTFTDVPMDEGSLGVHKIELMIKSGEDFGDGSRVGNHADGSHNLGQVTTWNDSWWLVVDTALETGWAPIDELDGSLGLDGGNSGVDILRDDITSVHQTASHILSVSWIALNHHRGWLEDGVGDFSNGQLFVVGLFSRDDWSIRGKHEMDSWVWHQVGLEFSDIDVKGTIESQRGGKGRDGLGDQSVQVGVGWSLNVQLSSADIVDSFVIEHDGDISVLQKRVSGQDRVVWLNNSGGDLWGWVDGETELRLLAVIDGKSFEEEGTETGTATTTDGLEDQETLETSTVVSELSDSVQAQIDDFTSNGVVTSGEIVGGIFLTGDQLFWMEQLSVGTGSDFVNNSWFQIEEDTSWDVLAGTGFREEGVEGIITTTDGLVRWHLTVRLDTVFEAEELPTGVTNLATSLTDVDRNNFSHCSS